MAVETVYRSSYRPTELFMDKSEADKYDRMLEIAENLGDVFRHVLPNMTEHDAETLSIFLAERREPLAAALKKNPAGIKALIEDQTGEAPSNVVPLEATA
jgi:dsDNA-binding SOS-regulon protein